MVRLNTRLLQSDPQLYFDSLANTHITIALLNVRSIFAKLPDIAKDNSLRSATIRCFCETWLDASQPSPLVHHDQIGIRCDRISCQNKGGVLICIPNQMQPTNTTRFAFNGI